METPNYVIDPLKIATDLLLILERDFSGRFEIRHLKTNDILFREGQSNRYLYILLEGIIELAKFDKFDIPVKVDWVRPGSMFGVLSFTTGRTTLTSAKAKSEGKVLLISLPSFERIRRESREFYELIGQLFIHNLIERYIHVVSIHMELDDANSRLEAERNTLKSTLEKLEASQSRLINQEKMAILGQLVAGFAHEVNNPASALMNSLDFMSLQMPELIHKLPMQSVSTESAFDWGIKQEPVSTLKTREFAKNLEREFPNLDRTFIRKIAQLPSEAQTEIIQKLEQDLKAGNTSQLAELLTIIDLGVAFKGMKISASRIAELVQSMKNYARAGNSKPEEIDVCVGLHDTILILSNRLKKRSLILELDEIPKLQGVFGELNQVWTNIIINACDATVDGGKLKISCGEVQNLIWVRFEDDGPGVPDSIKSQIFEANFTTKNSSGHFGLGLGLAISQQIIQHHNGEIELERSKELGGAQFTVWLPIG